MSEQTMQELKDSKSSLALLQENWLAKMRAVEALREALREAGTHLVELDKRLTRARRRLRTARENRRLNEAVAARNGLSQSPVARRSLARFQEQESASVQEIQLVLDMAVNPCAAYDRVLEELRLATRVEHSSLEVLTRARCLDEKLRKAAENRKRQLEHEAAEAEKVRLHRAREREEQQEREADCAQHPHYDPHYDPWEVRARRLRPWV